MLTAMALYRVHHLSSPAARQVNLHHIGDVDHFAVDHLLGNTKEQEEIYLIQFEALRHFRDGAAVAAAVEVLGAFQELG